MTIPLVEYYALIGDLNTSMNGDMFLRAYPPRGYEIRCQNCQKCRNEGVESDLDFHRRRWKKKTLEKLSPNALTKIPPDLS